MASLKQLGRELNAALFNDPVDPDRFSTLIEQIRSDLGRPDDTSPVC